MADILIGLSVCHFQQPSSPLAVIDATISKQPVILCKLWVFCFFFFLSYAEYFCRNLTVFSLICGLSVLWAVSRVRQFLLKPFLHAFLKQNPSHRQLTLPFPVYLTQTWPTHISTFLAIVIDPDRNIVQIKPVRIFLGSSQMWQRGKAESFSWGW